MKIEAKSSTNFFIRLFLKIPKTAPILKRQKRRFGCFQYIDNLLIYKHKSKAWFSSRNQLLAES